MTCSTPPKSPQDGTMLSIVEANPKGKFMVITEGRVRVRNLKLGGKG